MVQGGIVCVILTKDFYFLSNNRRLTFSLIQREKVDHFRTDGGTGPPVLIAQRFAGFREEFF
jgi:hypothetical protein